MTANDPLDRVIGDLAHPLRAGERALHDIEQRTRAVEAQLDHAAKRIDRAIVAAAAPLSRGVDVASHAAAHGLDAADLELSRAIRQCRTGAVRSRGLVDDVVEKVSGVQAKLTAMLDAVRYAARIETRDAGDRVVASSTIGWGGDSHSAMHPGLTEADLQLHLRRLNVTLRHRRSRVKFVAVILGGLSRVLAASSGGGLTALPALYRFVEQVLDAFEDLPALPAETPGATP